MTTHELARLLLAGPDIRALVDGYEGHADDVGHLCLVRVEMDEPFDSWSGRHRLRPDGSSEALLVSRHREEEHEFGDCAHGTVVR